VKQCTTCKEIKNLKDFYFDKRRNNQYSRCKSCHNKTAALYQKNKPESHRISQQKYELKGLGLIARVKYIKSIRDKYGLSVRTISLFGLQLALFVYDRAGRKCEACENKYNLTIHHIDGNGRHNKEKGLPMNNSPENLKVLCRSCHGRLHGIEGALAKKEKNKK
jgi:hypothetical protein